MIVVKFTSSLRDWRVPLQIQVAVRVMQVSVFGLHGAWQQNVSVVCGVGLKIINDDGKQVFASQASANPLLIGV